jgi:hypothetical protein
MMLARLMRVCCGSKNVTYYAIATNYTNIAPPATFV